MRLASEWPSFSSESATNRDAGAGGSLESVVPLTGGPRVRISLLSSGESAKHQSLSGGLLALVRSLCAYDLVGFQTQQDLDGFRDYLMRWARAEELGRGVWQAFGRTVRAQVFPISIDVCPVAAQAASADGTRHMGRLRQSVGNRTLMIGVDRLEESSYDAFAVVAVRMSALRLSAAISPSMPAFFKMAANSERRVATSLIAPSR
jgi:hypothetical protein